MPRTARRLVALRWRVARRPPGAGPRWRVRPFLSRPRLPRAASREPGVPVRAPSPPASASTWRPYAGVPGGRRARQRRATRPIRRGTAASSTPRSAARGLDCVEDLASPGRVRAATSRDGDARAAARRRGARWPAAPAAAATYARLRRAERARRGRFALPARPGRRCLPRATRRGQDDRRRATRGSPTGAATRSSRCAASASPPAGWATRAPSCSSGRGSSPRGCCRTASSTRATRPSTTRWTPRSGTSSRCTTTCAALEAARPHGRPCATGGPSPPRSQAILAGHVRGTRYGIRLAEDGLLAAGEPGVQLTWMDAKVGDWVVTPRIGKPVEIQALWLNALRIAERFDPAVRADLPARPRGLRGAVLERRRRLPVRRGGRGPRPRAARPDRSGPNQILAVGGLPFPLLDGERARRVVDAVERRLWTPARAPHAGRRRAATTAPRYEGDMRARDGAYHQGTVWPWLLGPFVEAWVRVRGGTAETPRGGAPPVPRAAARPT